MIAPPRWVLVLGTLIASTASVASAQGASPPNTAAAAEAYDRGSAYFLNGDYARAADWFRTAYRLAPAPAALLQALRAETLIERWLPAVNLALQLRSLHADHEAARALTDRTLDEHGGDFTLVALECEECQLEVEGRLSPLRSLYVRPKAEHHVSVIQGDRREAHIVRGEAGQRVTLGAPRGDAAVLQAYGELEPDSSEAEPGVGAPGAPADDGGLHPWVFAVSLGFTLASGGVTIGLGVDALLSLDAYLEMPTREGFEAGQARELRTNVFIGVTAGLAVLTALFAIFTDWDGTPEPASTLSLWVDSQNAQISLERSF